MTEEIFTIRLAEVAISDMAEMQMQPMSQFAGAPPTSALDYIATLSDLKILQQVELAEVVTGLDMRNRYSIQTAFGQQVLFCYEESGLCERICCKEHRGFTVHISDGAGQEVLTLTREFK